jgi:hypothetical protein
MNIRSGARLIQSLPFCCGCLVFGEFSGSFVLCEPKGQSLLLRPVEILSLREGTLLVAHGQRRAERRCGQLLKEMKEKGERDPGGRGKIASREDAQKKGSGTRLKDA